MVKLQAGLILTCGCQFMENINDCKLCLRHATDPNITKHLIVIISQLTKLNAKRLGTINKIKDWANSEIYAFKMRRNFNIVVDAERDSRIGSAEVILEILTKEGFGDIKA